MKNEIMKGASILTVVLMISMVFTPLATAAPILPHNRWGYIDSAAAGEYVYAFIDGVQYGDDLTEALGLFSVDTTGDDLELTGQKSGGEDGDTIQYVKSANANGGLRDGAADTFYIETGSFLSGSTNPNAPLNEVGASPDLLKINMVSVDSDLGVTDYIVLYSQAGCVATDFGISIDGGAFNAIDVTDLVAGLYDWNLMTIPPAGYLALDMGALANAYGYIMLEETSSGFIVDRVEYSSGEVAFVSPDDSVMTDEPVPGNGQEIYRNTPGEDTNSEWVPAPVQDFTIGANWLPIDTTAPISAVDAIAPYWYNTGPLAMTATADDIPLESGVAQVEFFYSYEGGAWTPFNVDAAFPYTANFVWGLEGNYEFYTIATDNAANVELAPVAADASAGYDITNPVADAGADMLLSVATQKTDATAFDALSGVFTTVWTYPVGVTCSNDNILDPVFGGTADGIYIVTLTVTDNAGNTHIDTFQLTWDGTPPEATTTVPLDEAMDVAIAAGIYIIDFSEPMAAVGAAITDLPGAVQSWADADTYQITYTVLTNDVEYNVDISAGGFEDLAGNALIQGTYDWIFNFTTIPAALRQAWVTDPTNDPAWTNVAAVTILYGEINDPTVVELFYTIDDGATWDWFGTETPTNGAFNWACIEDGAHGWFAQAEDEAPPVDGVDVPEHAGRYQYDGTDPTSSVDGPLNTWYNTSPLAMSATAGDATSGIAYVELWYSYNGGVYVLDSPDATSPYEWSFTWPGGDGMYDFYSIAVDNAGNSEAIPGVPDQSTGYDTQVPTTSVDAIVPSTQTVSPILLTVTAADNGPSGIDYVELWYTEDGGIWTYFGQDAASPYTFSFNFVTDPAYYEFYSIGVDIAGNVEGAPAGNDTWCLYDTGGGPAPATNVNDLLATGHEPTVNDIQLEWSEVAGANEYNVYESTNVDGTGFTFAAADWTVPGTGTGKVVYTVPGGKYADANSYSWVVRASNSGSETLAADGNNIAWKLMYELTIGAGAITPDLNYMSLPMKINITTNDAAALRNDIRAYGSPINGVNALGRWNSGTGLWEVKTAFGTNFALTPGEAYRIVPLVPSVWYKIVGSHDESVNAYDFNIGAGAITPDLNYIALPYHADLLDAAALRNDIRASGAPINGVNAIGRWNSGTGLWEVKTAFGTNFAITPGEAYRVVPLVGSVTWTAPVLAPGP